MTSGESTQRTSGEGNNLNIEIEISDQILFPTKVYPIPKNQSEGCTPLKLAIRLINNTSTPLILNRYQPFIPELLASDGRTIQRLFVGQPKYYLVQAGESELFVLDGTLSWHFEQLQLAIPNKAGGFYYFGYLKPGKYQIGLRYQVNVLKADYFKDKIPEKVWAGYIALPFVEFCLSEL